MQIAFQLDSFKIQTSVLRHFITATFLAVSCASAGRAVEDGGQPPQLHSPRPTLAQPKDAGDIDTLLRNLADLGPAKLTKRLAELKTQAIGLRHQERYKQEELDTLEHEAQAIDALVAGVKKLVKPPSDDDPRVPLPPVGEPWERHTIEFGLSKSEGARLGDINGDGLTDLAVGWEGQGVTRLYLNPGPAESTAPWQAITVGTTPNVEDSLLADLDHDGALDVVCSLEKGTEKVTVAWGPKDPADALNPLAWEHDEFKQVEHVSMWMYAAPIHLTPGGPVSLVIGGKNYKNDATAVLGLLVAPSDGGRDLSKWQWKPLCNLSWVMSIEVRDLDGDGLEDILYSDKHGPLAGVHWLKNPGDENAAGDKWIRTTLTTPEVKGANFLTIADLDKDGLDDILAVVELDRKEGDPDNAHRRVQWFRRIDPKAAKFEMHEILMPPGVAQPKGIAVGDIDLDGRNDIVITSSGAYGDLIGTSWLRYDDSPFDKVWKSYNIAGPEGVKYDLVYLVDLDDDGDLDVVANDEKEPDKSGKDIGLGVFWYENPTVSTKPQKEDTTGQDVSKNSFVPSLKDK